MIVTAWRLVKWKNRGLAFSGEGSRLYGGRWNSPGFRVIYCGESQALSALETIVHFDKGRTPLAYAFLPLQFETKLIQELGHGLPPNWATMPAVTAALGDAWLSDHKNACILSVPTALVPNGVNYLINPMHPDFEKVALGQAIPFAFDGRITTERELVKT